MDDTVRVRVLPVRRGTSTLVHAHLEAYDHLAVAIDHADGSIELMAPRTREDELRLVVADFTARLGVLVVG